MVTRVPSLFLSFFSLTTPPSVSGVPSFFFFLQYPLPERPEQPVCPSRLSECATSRLDTLHGRRDRDGPRGDPALRRPPKQINTAKRRRGRAADKDEANRQFCGGCFFFFFPNRWDPRCQNGDGGEGRAQRAARASGMAEQQLNKAWLLTPGSVHPVFRLPVHCHTGVQ